MIGESSYYRVEVSGRIGRKILVLNPSADVIFYALLLTDVAVLVLYVVEVSLVDLRPNTGPLL